MWVSLSSLWSQELDRFPTELVHGVSIQRKSSICCVKVWARVEPDSRSPGKGGTGRRWQGGMVEDVSQRHQPAAFLPCLGGCAQCVTVFSHFRIWAPPPAVCNPLHLAALGSSPVPVPGNAFVLERCLLPFSWWCTAPKSTSVHWQSVKSTVLKVN